ncbi:MAG: RNA polymerase sigma factor, partial [Planctomycetota bacterium]
MDTTPEQDFARFARHGDGAAAERALRPMLPRMYAYACRLQQDVHAAEEAVQEALVRLLRTAWRYDGSVPLTAWCLRLVHEQVGKGRRSAGRRVRHETRAGEVLAMQQIHDAQPDPEQVEALHRALERLPARYREI